jgi:hypothetical protein
MRCTHCRVFYIKVGVLVDLLSQTFLLLLKVHYYALLFLENNQCLFQVPFRHCQHLHQTAAVAISPSLRQLLYHHVLFQFLLLLSHLLVFAATFLVALLAGRILALSQLLAAFFLYALIFLRALHPWLVRTSKLSLPGCEHVSTI